jgi:hypothetical protein
MVHFVKKVVRLPTGKSVRCEVCRDGGTVYHRTTVDRFEKMVRDSFLNPLVCEADVLSFSRLRDQRLGGSVCLVFREKDLPHRREMCYCHPDDSDKLAEAQHLLWEAIRRERDEPDTKLQPVTKLHAYLGVTRHMYRRECEVMSAGCIPLERALKVEYWLDLDCNENEPWTGTSPEDTLRTVRQMKHLADSIGKPLEIKSCTPAIAWRKGEITVWATLDHRALDGMLRNEWPEAEGYVGMYTLTKFNGAFKVDLKCKCRDIPRTSFEGLNVSDTR